MNYPIRFLLLATLALAACGNGASDPDSASIEYPVTEGSDHSDTYHGTVVADPYRWLEDDVRESDAVKQWVDRQNEVTFAYLETIEEREPIRARLEELWNFERFGLPRKEGGRYFYSHNGGLQNQSVIFTQASLDDEPELLIDPNIWSDDGTIALASYFPSPDGKHFAYLVQESGSDWRSAKIMNLDSGEVLDDELLWLKFTALAWAADGSGFYYNRFPPEESEVKYTSLNMNHAVYFHRIGDQQQDDLLVYTRPEHPEWLYGVNVTDDGRYLVITIAVGTDDRYQIVYQDLRTDGAEPVMLIEGFDFDYTLAGSQGSELYFRTNIGAPRGKLIAIDVERPEPDDWREVIPEAKDVLSQASIVGGRVIGEYMQDAWSLVRIYDTDGIHLETVDLPGIGSASGFSGRADDPETFFRYESYDTPDTINRLNVVTGEVNVFKSADVDFDSDDYVVEQVFYESRDRIRHDRLHRFPRG